MGTTGVYQGPLLSRWAAALAFYMGKERRITDYLIVFPSSSQPC